MAKGKAGISYDIPAFPFAIVMLLFIFVIRDPPDLFCRGAVHKFTPQPYIEQAGRKLRRDYARSHTANLRVIALHGTLGGCLLYTSTLIKPS